MGARNSRRGHVEGGREGSSRAYAHYGAGGDGGGNRRAAPLPGDAGLYFLGALHELVAVGLHRPALEALCAGQRDLAEPPIDRAYLLQDPRRGDLPPVRASRSGRLIELVLNAADAARAPQPVVDVAVTDGRVEVSDAGVGMGLRATLSRLLIPFATDKRPGIDLGRFGVGFFSVLGLGLSIRRASACTHHRRRRRGLGDPRRGLAQRGRGVRRARGRLGGGRASPRPRAARAHRRPHVLGAPDRAAARDARARHLGAARDRHGPRLLRDALHFFPASRALVLLDGAAVNDGRLISGGQLIQERVAVAPPGAAALEARAHLEDERGDARLARFHVGGRGLLPSISAATFHAGVKVDACLALAELALIDFPAAVELTEGRDALKVGPEFTAVATAFYRRLIELAAASGEGRRTRDRRLAEMAAQISALMLQSAGWDEVALDPARRPARPRALHGDPRAARGAARVPRAERGRAAVRAGELLGGARVAASSARRAPTLLEDELEIDAPETLSALARRRAAILGGCRCSSRGRRARTRRSVALCRSRAPAGSRRGRGGAPGAGRAAAPRRAGAASLRGTAAVPRHAPGPARPRRQRGGAASLGLERLGTRCGPPSTGPPGCARPISSAISSSVNPLDGTAFAAPRPGERTSEASHDPDLVRAFLGALARADPRARRGLPAGEQRGAPRARRAACRGEATVPDLAQRILSRTIYAQASSRIGRSASCSRTRSTRRRRAPASTSARPRTGARSRSPIKAAA